MTELEEKKLKKLHEIMTVEFKMVHDICERNNIKYVANGGTCLGAIREKGFIPWDDDVDIMFIREDYNKLLKVLPEELKKYNYEGHPYYFTDYNGVRGIDIGFNIDDELLGKQFVFVGCIIYDKLPKSKLKQNIMRFRLYCYRAMIKRPRTKSSLLHTCAEKYFNFIGAIKGYKRVQKESEKVATRYNTPDNDYGYYIATNDAFFAMLYRNYDAKWFEERILVPFENIEIYVPKRYDDYLTFEYGDYMKRPPVDEQKPAHGKL